MACTEYSCTPTLKQKRPSRTVHTYLEYHNVCLLVRIGTPPFPPPLASVSRGGGGGPNSDDWRKSLALCLLCAFPIGHIPLSTLISCHTNTAELSTDHLGNFLRRVAFTLVSLLFCVPILLIFSGFFLLLYLLNQEWIAMISASPLTTTMLQFFHQAAKTRQQALQATTFR